jgi:hypothetical protein
LATNTSAMQMESGTKRLIGVNLTEFHLSHDVGNDKVIG